MILGRAVENDAFAVGRKRWVALVPRPLGELLLVFAVAGHDPVVTECRLLRGHEHPIDVPSAE